MRKIDKSNILSTDYEDWVDKKNKDKEKHPRWDCGHKYYIDVLMNLLHCQGYLGDRLDFCTAIGCGR